MNSGLEYNNLAHATAILELLLRQLLINKLYSWRTLEDDPIQHQCGRESEELFTKSSKSKKKDGRTNIEEIHNGV